MANSAQQIDQLDDLDALFADTEDGSIDNLEFEVEEVAVEDESDAALKAAQEEMAAEEEVEAEEDLEAQEEVAEEDLESQEEVAAEEGDVADELDGLDDIDLEGAPDVAGDEEASLDDLEADLKAEERQAKLEAATLTEEEAAKLKSESTTMGKEAAKQKAKRESKPHEPKDAINVSEAVSSKVGASTDDWKMYPAWTEVEAEAYRDDVLAKCDLLPKKTREKALNLIDWHVRGSSLSVYSRIALDQLISAGEITSASLRHRYMSNPGKSYTTGTSNAQTGQLMKILTTFGMIDEDGKVHSGHAMIKKFKATGM